MEDHEMPTIDAQRMCNAINGNKTMIPILMLETMSVQMTEETKNYLCNEGYSEMPDSSGMTKGDVRIYRIHVGSCELFVTYDESNNDAIMHAGESVDKLVQPSYVADFIAVVSATVKIPDPLYRGHSVIGLAHRMAKDKYVTDVITGNNEIRERKQCEECMHFYSIKHNSKCADNGDVMKALEKCRDANLIDPAYIKTDLVYLGYDATRDTFLLGFDVTGSDNTKSVVIGFKIDAYGRPYDCSAGNEGVSQLDIYDGSADKFMEGRKMYKYLQGGKADVIDIFVTSSLHPDRS